MVYYPLGGTVSRKRQVLTVVASIFLTLVIIGIAGMALDGIIPRRIASIVGLVCVGGAIVLTGNIRKGVKS